MEFYRNKKVLPSACLYLLLTVGADAKNEIQLKAYDNKDLVKVTQRY